MSRGKRFRALIRSARFNLLMMALFLVLSIVGMDILQRSLLANSQETGMSLAQSFSVEEERNIFAYETLMELESEYLESYLQEGASEEELQEWISSFYQNVNSVFDKTPIDPYAVVDGRVIAAQPWEGDEALDLESTVWYRPALEADGETVFSDVYMDAIHDRPVITISKKCGESNAVLAFDIFPENFRITSNAQELPQGSSYYLCDTGGTLLYFRSAADITTEQAQEYVDMLLSRITEGSLHAPESYVYDMNGRQRAVYYNTAQNGWISIITVPSRTILEDLRRLTFWFSILFGIFLLFTVLVAVREYRLNRDINRTNETVRVLGNSYYAIYRIDFGKATYDMIKGSDYIRSRLPRKGDYEKFLRASGEVIEKNAYQEFIETFSLENIRALVAKRTRDFGGDFLRLFDTGYRWVNVRLLFDESLNPNEAVLCFREVDAEKQQQLQHLELLRNSLETAKKSEESQKRFFSSMSHDMRTPLNAILGLSDLAGKHLDDPGAVKEYLSKIHYSSSHLLMLINDILEISRLEQGQLSLENQTFDLEKCVRDCCNVFEIQAKQQDKKFSLRFQAEDTMVSGDAFRLGQILNNLLSNALKFTAQGDSVSVDVRQVQNQEYGRYQISVQDTGAGMSEEFLEKIFVPYERETRFGARNVQGTGLGMPIVKSIISQMGGQITVSSRLGEGSTFTVTLPLVPVRQEDRAAEDLSESQDQAQRRTASLEGRRILLAEDNEINMEITTEILQMNGVLVTQAWNGREAVEAFERSAPGEFDAILMDMQMPEMDGCEAARRIRRLPREDAAKIPILAVTANAFAEDIAATTKAGMNAHISKPIDFSVLCDTLSSFLPG